MIIFGLQVNPVPEWSPPGTRNKKTEKIFKDLEAQGDKGPGDLLSSIVTNEKEPTDLRVRAADMLIVQQSFSEAGDYEPRRSTALTCTGVH